VCDRFAVSVHALMYSPKKQQAGARKNSKPLVESKNPGRWTSEESTSADSDGKSSKTSVESDAEDVRSEVSRTTSAARSSGSDAASRKPNTASAADDDGEEEELATSSENSIEALLEREGMQALLKQVPKDEHGNLCSVGSIPHATGACKPCVFAHSERKSCQNGVECLFCHLPHAPKKRMRFCKKKRMEIKRTGSNTHEQ